MSMMSPSSNSSMSMFSPSSNSNMSMSFDSISPEKDNDLFMTPQKNKLDFGMSSLTPQTPKQNIKGSLLDDFEEIGDNEDYQTPQKLKYGGKRQQNKK